MQHPRRETTVLSPDLPISLRQRPDTLSCSHCWRRLALDPAYIVCAHGMCTSRTICIPCFHVGAADEHPHQPDHPYRIIESNNIPLLEPDWSANEELRLVHALCDYGLGHWKAVAARVGKPQQQCEQHYIRVYLSADTLIPASFLEFPSTPPLPNSNADRPLPASNSHSLQYRSCAPSPVNRTPFLPQSPEERPTIVITLGGRTTKLERGTTIPCHSNDSEDPGFKVAPDPSYGNDTNVEGCMPRRGDLDIEFDNDAEETVADIVIDEDDTEQEKELKLQLLQIYDKRLARREQITEFILMRDLIHVDKIEIGDATNTQEEKELLARIQIFSRLLSDNDFRKFKDAVMSEYSLSNKIHYLKQCRAAGVKRNAEIGVYGIECQTRAAQLGNKGDLGWRRPNFLIDPIVEKNHIKFSDDHTTHRIPPSFIKKPRITQIPPDPFCTSTTDPPASIRFTSDVTDNCMDRPEVEVTAPLLQNLLSVSTTSTDDARCSHKMIENGTVVTGNVSATLSPNEETSEAVQQPACAKVNPGSGSRNTEKGTGQSTSDCQRSTDCAKGEPQIPVNNFDNNQQTSHIMRGLSVAEARTNNSSNPGVECASSQPNIYDKDLATTRETLLPALQLQTDAGYGERQMNPERPQKQKKSSEAAAKDKDHVGHERSSCDGCNSNCHNQQRPQPLQGLYPLLDPMPLNGLPDLWKLTPTERKISSALHIEPTEFLRQRDAMLAQAKYRLQRNIGVPASGEGRILTLRCAEISQVEHQELAKQEEIKTKDPRQTPLNVAPAVPVDPEKRQVQSRAPVFVNEADPLKRKKDKMCSKAETQLVSLPSQKKSTHPSAGGRYIPLNPRKFTAADDSTGGDKEYRFSASGNIFSQLKADQKLEPERYSDNIFCPPYDSGPCNNQCSFNERCRLCIARLIGGSDDVVEVDGNESHRPVASSADQTNERIRKAPNERALQTDGQKDRHSGSVEDDCHRDDKTGSKEMTDVTDTRQIKVISQWRPLKSVESCTPCQDALTNVKETVLGGMTEVQELDENVSAEVAGEREGSNVNALLKVRVKAGIMVIGKPRFGMEVNVRDSHGNDDEKLLRPEESQKRRRVQHDDDNDRRVKRKRWKRRVFLNREDENAKATREESAGGEANGGGESGIDGDFDMSEHETPNSEMRRRCDHGQTRGRDTRKRYAQEGPDSANSKMKENIYGTDMDEDNGNHVCRERAGKRMMTKKGLPKVLLQLRLKKPEKQGVSRRRTRAQTRAAMTIASERKAERRRGYRTRAVAKASRRVIESNDLPPVASTHHGRKGQKMKVLRRSSDERQAKGSSAPEFAEGVLGDSKEAPATKVQDASLSLNGKGKRNVLEGRQGAIESTAKMNTASNSKWDVDDTASNVERDEAVVRTQLATRRSHRVGKMRVVEADVDDSLMAVVKRDRMRRACRVRPEQDVTDENDGRNARPELKLLDENIVWIERSVTAGESNNANIATAVGTSRQDKDATSTMHSKRDRRNSVVDSGQEDRTTNGHEKRYKLRRRA